MKDILITIDFRSSLPIYVQIVDQISQMIANGDLQPGVQLPTVRQMAIDLRVNWNTVARAYKLLDEAGLISTQQGRGTYVWETPKEEAMAQLRQQALAGLIHRFLDEASRLGCTPEEVSAAMEQHINSWKAGVLPENTD